MSEYYTLTTNTGLAKITAAINNGSPINLIEMAVGDSQNPPDESYTQLGNEVYRFDVQSVIQDSQNTNWLRVQGFIPPTDGNFTIRELGIFDEDGDLIFVARHPEVFKPVLSDGSAIETVIRLTVQVSNAAAVTLQLDPSLILAYQSDLHDQNTDTGTNKDVFSIGSGTDNEIVIRAISNDEEHSYLINRDGRWFGSDDGGTTEYPLNPKYHNTLNKAQVISIINQILAMQAKSYYFDLTASGVITHEQAKNMGIAMISLPVDGDRLTVHYTFSESYNYGNGTGFRNVTTNANYIYSGGSWVNG